MFADGREVEPGSVLETDLCIVGAGPAGITLALELADSPIRVILLESGGWKPDASSSDLNEGEVVGQPYRSLELCRMRIFGGTTGHWNGWCRPLDEIDFESRAWIPHSGWPFAREELRDAYHKAQELCELGPLRYDAEAWRHPEGTAPFPLDPERVCTSLFQISPTHFGTTYKNEIAKLPNVLALLHSTAVELQRHPQASRLAGMKVETLTGNGFEVRAGAYVLAAGGIENARLLLLSRRRRQPALGNEHGRVGRFFMEHLHLTSSAFLVPSSAETNVSYYAPWKADETRVSGVMAPTPGVLRRNEMLNFSAALYPVRFSVDDLHENTVPGVLTDLGERLLGSEEDSIEGFPIHCRAEQQPNADNRVTLSDELDRDAFGLPRPRLEWRLSDRDVADMRNGLRIIGTELVRAGIGRVYVPEDTPEWRKLIGGGCHHMGTTRMAADPQQGVVDGNCKVHTADNLYIAGSSVFPTSGFANPTLTIVAMAVRLARHLENRFG